MAIRIRKEEDGRKGAQIISLLELLEEMRVDENAKRIPLPDNWQQLSDEALKAYTQYFIRIKRSRAGDKRTLAQGFIVKLYENDIISAKSKRLLESARKLVDKGNFDVIKKMLAIKQELENRNQNLFAINQQDIDEILEREIAKLVAQVENKQGVASIVLGTIK